MKAWPAGLITLLATRSFVFVDLYTITLVTGAVLRYTTGPIDVNVGGNIFSSQYLYVDDLTNKSVGHWTTGLDVGTWVVHMIPAQVEPVTGTAFPAKILGQPWLAAAASGMMLQGATVQVDRGYWAAWPAASSQWVPSFIGDKVFLGRIAAVDVMRDRAIITINSLTELLSVVAPPNLCQTSCRHTLFDAGCTLSQAAFAVAGNVVTGGDQSIIQIASFTGAIPGSATITLGQILWTSGANSGFRRSVRLMFFPGTVIGLQLIAPMPFPVAAGDTFTAYPGCDKTFATCGQFANQANYGGTGMTVPAPETSI